MEKERDNHENEDDEIETRDYKKSKNSKNKSKESNSEEKIDNIEEPRRLKSFFQKKESKKEEKLEKESEDSQDEEPNLTEEEVQEVTIAIIDSLTQEVSEELNNTEPDSIEEFVSLADAIFLEELLDIANDEEDITAGSIERAFQETIDDLSLDENIELEDVDIVNDSIPNVDLYSPVEEDANQFNVPATPPSAFPQLPPNSISPNSTSHNLPLPPVNNYQKQNYNNSNQTGPVATPNNAVENKEIIHGRRSDMLVGAIIGYIVGRRGGRKRTEKKLFPKINNLEKQVTELQTNILEKEVLIRKIAEKNISKVENYSNKTTVVIERRKAKKEVIDKLKKREELSKDPSVEKIGKFSLPALKVFHERRLPDGNENSPKRKQVEVMTENELLDKVAGLKIHGLDVANMYQRKRLTLKTLRQITKEYLRGGDFKQTFSLELLPDEQEIYEKRRQVNSSHQKPQNTEIGDNLPKTRRLDVEKANKMADALLFTEKQTNTTSDSKKVIISGMITGIVIASILLVILLIN